MRRVYNVILVGRAALLLLLGVAVAKGTTASFSVAPTPKQVEVGASFTVTVAISNVELLHGSSVTVRFDSEMLDYEGTTWGSFYPSGGFFGYTWPPASVATDTVTIDQALKGTTVISGSGDIFSIQFRALKGGCASLLLEPAVMRDISNNDIPSTVTHGLVLVGTTIVNAKAWLQGPYASGSMGTSLKAAGFIPLSQPYTTPPWNYTGSEFVASIPAGVVDWVLVEVRSGTVAATIAGRRAAFIRSDGTIVDVDGSSPVLFGGISTGSYYLVLRHRNHLAVMSAAAVALSASSALYDFTTGPGQYYGGEAAALASGVYGLWAGDVSGNGVLKYMGSGNDRSPILTRIGGTSLTATVNGYFAEDVNMNGVVKYMGTGNDRSIILANVGGNLTATKTTQVPD